MKSMKHSALLLAGACASLMAVGCNTATEEDLAQFNEEGEYVAKTQALVAGCTASNSVPLMGPNVSNRLGSNACVSIIPPFLPGWWQYTDGTARVQIANFDDQDPNENAFPLTVEWANTCGTESGSVTYTQPWEQHELGHPSDECTIVISLGGEFSEDVLIFWGA